MIKVTETHARSPFSVNLFNKKKFLTVKKYIYLVGEIVGHLLPSLDSAVDSHQNLPFKTDLSSDSLRTHLA